MIGIAGLVAPEKHDAEIEARLDVQMAEFSAREDPVSPSGFAAAWPRLAPVKECFYRSLLANG
jgi:hypothetical protein